MLTPRLLTLSLLLSAAIPSAIAQSAPATPLFTTPAAPPLNRPVPAMRFITPMQFGPASPTPAATPSTNPFMPAQRAPITLSPRFLELFNQSAPILIARGQDEFCLDLRTYTVAPDSPGSDSTHLTGSSTCQPAANFKLKATVDQHTGPRSGLYVVLR